MLAFPQRVRHGLIAVWTVAVLVFVFLPGVTILLASLTASRYFTFPIPSGASSGGTRSSPLRGAPAARDVAIDRGRSWSLPWRSASSLRSPLPAMTGAGARSTSGSCSCPSSFRRPCSASMLLWFNAIGLELSWKTAVFAHLVWIVPVVTLVMAIQLYSFDPALEEAAFDLGASRWQVFREVTLPVLRHLFRRVVRVPIVVGQLSVVALHDWRRYDGAGVPLCQDGRRYTPGVPVLGTVSTIGATLILLGGYVLIPIRGRKRELAVEATGERARSRGRGLFIEGGVHPMLRRGKC